MNAIYATNILVWSEACLASMAIYVEQLSLITAMRITTAIPENDIITTMLPWSFPTKREIRMVINCRAAFDSNKGGMKLKVWSFKCNTTA